MRASFSRNAGIVALALGLCGLAGAARAQVATDIGSPEMTDTSWSATAARTVGAGNGMILGQAGWPGISIQYSRGLDAQTDLGLRASFLYGFESTTNSLAGLNLALPYRRLLVDSGRTAISGHIDPGITFYGNRGQGTGNVFGVGAPAGVVAGWQMNDRLTLDAGADFVTLLSFSNPVGIFFAPMVGVGAEYKLERNVAFTVQTRVGPEFAVVNGGQPGELAFQALLGIAYGTR